MRQIRRLFMLPLYLGLLTFPMHIEASCKQLRLPILKTAVATLFICSTALFANGDELHSLVEENDLYPLNDDVSNDASFFVTQSEEVGYDQDDLLSVLLGENGEEHATLASEKGIFFDDNWVIIPGDMSYKQADYPRRLQDDEGEDIAYDTTMSNLELLIRIALIPVGCYIWCCCDRRGKCTPDGNYGMCIVGCDVVSVGLEMCSEYVGESSCCQSCADGCMVVTCAKLECFGLRCCGWCRKSFYKKKDEEEDQEEDEEEDRREKGGNERRREPRFNILKEENGLGTTDYLDDIIQPLKDSYEVKKAYTKDWESDYGKMNLWEYILNLGKSIHERSPIDYLCCRHKPRAGAPEVDAPKAAETTKEIEVFNNHRQDHKGGTTMNLGSAMTKS